VRLMWGRPIKVCTAELSAQSEWGHSRPGGSAASVASSEIAQFLWFYKFWEETIKIASHGRLDACCSPEVPITGVQSHTDACPSMRIPDGGMEP
jgi:hypothetical protein